MYDLIVKEEFNTNLIYHDLLKILLDVLKNEFEINGKLEGKEIFCSSIQDSEVFLRRRLIQYKTFSLYSLEYYGKEIWRFYYELKTKKRIIKFEYLTKYEYFGRELTYNWEYVKNKVAHYILRMLISEINSYKIYREILKIEKILSNRDYKNLFYKIIDWEKKQYI